MKTQLSKSADQKIRTKGILCAQMREIKRKNTLDRKSNVEKTLILSRVFLFWIRGVRNQCFPTAPSLSTYGLLPTYDDGVPICRLGLHMHKDGYKAAKYWCPKANRKRGCFCEHPCSPTKYDRTVHIFSDDNPKLFNIPQEILKHRKKNTTEEPPWNASISARKRTIN